MAARIKRFLLLAIIALSIAIAIEHRHALDGSSLVILAADAISVPKP